ncbi:MAG: ATP-binding protein [Verrucomicrobia subdivision 3 bacterium]|nr:ATP-binding protein [Limisphaerales bacterium]
MDDKLILSDPEFRAALLSNEREERISTGKLASALVVFLMPLGVVLDYFVYPAKLKLFLFVRLLCSALAALLWYLHKTDVGIKHYRLLGLPIALLPAAAISWMIYATEGPVSPYYAGLNLILLAISVVVRWNVRESLLACAAVMLMYLAAALPSFSQPQLGTFVNNFYFLGLTGIIMIAGNYLFNRLRFREFVLRYELNQNRAQLEENNQKLKQLDEAKGRFFANISHELRTPLTLLLAPLESLLNRFKSSFDEETRNLLVTMHSNGMRLLKLINDLLDLVRLESGRMVVKREPLGMSDFLKGMASAARQMANDKRITLETHVDPAVGRVMADRDKLEKMILNLQFNALKFTPAGGRIELRAEIAGDELVLSVKDTGMGISEQNLANLFSRFWQADDSSRRKYQGVGIGLALVKEFTELQGGTVSVQSELSKGSTFTIRLPYEVAPEGATAVESEVAVVPAAGTASNEEWLTNLYRRAELFPGVAAVQDSVRRVENVRNGNLPKLLVADDEPDMLRFLKSQLSSHYQVIEAVDGQQAVEKASQFLPDVILLDMMMPEKDGLQACKEIHERAATQTIPIILLTARADEETKLKALSMGASDFLPKPFSTTELHVRIKNLVESYSYQRKLSKQNTVLENTIEQLKETETQLVQTEKLASLGRMSAGIIHEINNPLNFATTGLYTLRNKVRFIAPEEQEEYAEILKDVEEGIKRVKTIVSDLRSFSHFENEQMEQVEVADLVTASLRFLSHQLKDQIQIEQRIAEHQTIWANKNKMINVLVNLIQNSVDAIERKSFGDGEKPWLTIEGRIERGRTMLVVRDNGEGIEPQNLDKIFDPFFTTKDVGEGMGLGLSICYRIVQEYDGLIRVRSEHGQYCEFTLDFPLKGEPASQSSQEGHTSYAKPV